MKEYIHFRRNGQTVSFFRTPTEFAGNAFLPQKALVPISIDAAKASPVVSYGQYVEEGELLARALDANACDVHSPVPGFVGDLVRFQSDYHSSFECLPVLLEGRFEMLGKRESKYQWRNTSVLELLRLIETKGLIVTTKPFLPLAKLLRSNIRENNKTIQFALFDFDISCGLEAELLRNFFWEVIEGLAIAAKIIDCRRIEFFYLGKLEPSIKEKIQSIVDFCECVFLRTKNNYPFYDLSKQEKDTPLVLLPSTVLYVYEAIVKDRPFISSYILLGGTAVNHPKLLKARIGTPIGNLIEECGGLRTASTTIILNGFLDGVKTKSFDIPINKTIKSITVIPLKHERSFFRLPCNSCACCTAACPMHLNPAQLLRKIQRKDFDEIVLLQLRQCINCGVCSSCCECRIPLARIFAKAKEERGL